MAATDPMARAFLADILAHPDDDVPRLIYADWLDDQAGQATPRAELIRLQCALATDPESLAFAARKRVRDLVRQRGREWSGLIDKKAPRGLLERNWPALGWRRGFVAEVRGEPMTWSKAAAYLQARHPVDQLTLDAMWVQDQGLRIASDCRPSPALRRVILVLSNEAMPYMAELQRLRETVAVLAARGIELEIHRRVTDALRAPGILLSESETQPNATEWGFTPAWPATTRWNL